MIHSAALPALPGLLLPCEMTPALAAEGLEGADFSALLAIEAGSVAPAETAAAQPISPLPVAPLALPDTAVLPEGGKTLPLEPAGEPPVPAPTDAAPALAIASPVVPYRPIALITARPVPVSEPAPKAAKGGSEVPATPDPVIAGGLPVIADNAPVATALIAPETSGPARYQPAPVALVAAHHAPPEPPASTAPSDPPQPRQQPAPGAPQIVPATPQPAPLAVALAVVTVPQGTAPLVAQTRLHLALPAAARASRTEISAAIPAEPRPRIATTAIATAPDRLAPAAPVLPVSEPALPAAGLPAPTPHAAPAPATLAPADPALRPHDFTQLVERLVAARELVQPQTFQVAVRHGEFGPVQLRFRQEGDGLSVTLASADPDFARVVSVAPPPVLLPVTTTDPAASQRSDNPSQSASTNGHSAQHRGGSPERREDRHGPADNPAPARQNDGRGSRRSGIFA